MTSILVLILSFSLANQNELCSRDWALEGQLKSKNMVYGLGLSNSPDKAVASTEAQQNAIKDLAQQLQTNVTSQSTLKETEAGSTYSGSIDVVSSIKNLTGIKNIKEGENASKKITACKVVQFDARSSYSDYEGKMNVLEKSLSEVMLAAKQKRYIDVLKKRESAKKLVRNEIENIQRADLLRVYLKESDQSWYEKFKTQELEIDKVAEEAKQQIVFVIPESSDYEVSLSELESKLSGVGFDVQKSSQATKPVNLKIEIKMLGSPRKTKTALGITLISKVMISLKDGSRTISTNKGEQIIGTGSSEEDALANIDRQLLVHLLSVVNQGLPGLIPDDT